MRQGRIANHSVRPKVGRSHSVVVASAVCRKMQCLAVLFVAVTGPLALAGSDDGQPSAQLAGDSTSSIEGRQEEPRAVGTDDAGSRRQRRSSRFPPKRAAVVPWYRSGLGAMAIVLAVIVLVTVALRRWLPAAKTVDHSMLRVVARTNVSPKHHAALIQLGRRFVLVGVSPDGMRTLCEVRDGDEASELSARLGSRVTQAFDEQLLDETRLYERTDGESVSRAATDESEQNEEEPMTDLLQKLRKLRV